MQLATQGDKLPNTPINVPDVAPSDAIHFGAGAIGLFAQRQQLPHGGYVKT